MRPAGPLLPPGLPFLPHDVCNAILLPHVSEFNLITAPERFAKIAELLGESIGSLGTSDAAKAVPLALPMDFYRPLWLLQGHPMAGEDAGQFALAPQRVQCFFQRFGQCLVARLDRHADGPSAWR